MAPAGIGLFIFDIGWSELVVIGVVALIAIGPKELPTVLRTLGQYMGKIKRMSAEFQSQFQEALREAEMSDLKQHAQDIQTTVTDFAKFDPLANAEKDMAHAFGAPESASAATETVVTQPAPTEAAAAEPSVQAAALDVPLPETTVDPMPEAPAHPAQKQA
jgi:sec-independent protein translocase protein TatB